MSATAQAPRSEPAERSSFSRVRIDLLGRFMREDRTEFPCRAENMSPGDVSVTASVVPVENERIITVMTAGNLATTQAVVSQLEERMKAPDERDNVLLKSPTMFQVASEIGTLLREIISDRQEANGIRGRDRFTASIIVAGQIRGMEPRLFLVYPEGNFIEAGQDNPFFQSGETKYGRPILVRAYDPKMSFEEAVKLLLVSFDSTIRANAGVDPPIDLQRDGREDGSVLIGVN